MIDKPGIESILGRENLTEYRWINPKDIVVAQWVRVKCYFGCGDLGLAVCPPNTPSVEECDRFFKEYNNGLIFGFSKFADKNEYPTDWSKEITNKLIRIETELFLSGYYKAFLLNQATCSLCKECVAARADCKDKVHARPSPESFAVDVYSTVRNAGMKLDVVSENPAHVHRIAILLID